MEEKTKSISKKNIKVYEEVHEELNVRKKPGETFDDVLRRVLDLPKMGEKTMSNEATYSCECGEPLIDMYMSAGDLLMVECPVHGLHEWGDVDE